MVSFSDIGRGEALGAVLMSGIGAIAAFLSPFNLVSAIVQNPLHMLARLAALAGIGASGTRPWWWSLAGATKPGPNGDVPRAEEQGLASKSQRPHGSGLTAIRAPARRPWHTAAG